LLHPSLDPRALPPSPTRRSSDLRRSSCRHPTRNASSDRRRFGKPYGACTRGTVRTRRGSCRRRLRLSIREEAMARRKQTADVRVYRDDWNGPVENVELVRDQAFRAHRYYNKLVEIERERRNRYEEIREQMCPGFAEVEAKVEDLDQQIDALRAEINADKARERTRRVDQEKAARLKELREQRKALFAELKQKRDEFNAAIGSAAEEFRRRYKARIGESKDVGLMFEARSETLEEMLAEPEWSDAWKAVARSDAEGVAKAKLARAESGL